MDQGNPWEGRSELGLHLPAATAQPYRVVLTSYHEAREYFSARGAEASTDLVLCYWEGDDGATRVRSLAEAAHHFGED